MVVAKKRSKLLKKRELYKEKLGENLLAWVFYDLKLRLKQFEFKNLAKS